MNTCFQNFNLQENSFRKDIAFKIEIMLHSILTLYIQNIAWNSITI